MIGRLFALYSNTYKGRLKKHPQRQNCKVWANWFESKAGTIKRAISERTNVERMLNEC